MLSIGQKFSRVLKLSISNLVAPIEHYTFKNSIISLDSRILFLSVFLTLFLRTFRQQTLISSLLRNLFELNSAQNLSITKTGKGGRTVLFNKSNYISHTNIMMLSNPCTMPKKSFHSTFRTSDCLQTFTQV